MPDQGSPVGRRLAILACLAVSLAACADDSAEDGAAVEGDASGVSREEMVDRATPMTLEEAESLGIVDTTVRVAPPVGPDSLPIYNPTASPGDSAP